ncbi:hypothetical protein [Kribbella sp. NPDC000426]|uniref:hypothetical protein n=1 Tax=Kribbella sp. NPDC000426 TaxID=3154255 RepID=UPI003329E0EF
MIDVIRWPRSGKTGEYAAPTIVEASDTVIVTSNTRIALDADRGDRESRNQDKCHGGVAVLPATGRQRGTHLVMQPLSYVVDDDTARERPTARLRLPGRRRPR